MLSHRTLLPRVRDQEIEEIEEDKGLAEDGFRQKWCM